MKRSARVAAWTALLLFAVAAIVWQSLHRAGPQVDADDVPAGPLVSLAYAQWSAVELLIQGEGERVRFERDAAGHWFRHQTRAGEAAGHAHPIDVATAGRIDATLATFSRTRIERSIAADARRMTNYGLTNPELIVLIHAADARIALTVEVGQVAADALSRYVHVPQTNSVHTIPDYQIRGLQELLGATATPAIKP